MVLLRKVCCCINLTRNGAAIGWITLFNAFLLLASAVHQVVHVFNIINYRPAVQVAIKIIKTLGLSYFFVNLLTIVASALVIVGIAKRSASLLKPWLIISLITLTLFFLRIMNINEVIMRHHYHINIKLMIFELIVFGLEVYLYLAVFSLFQIYKDESSFPKYDEPYQEERRLLIRPEIHPVPALFAQESTSAPAHTEQQDEKYSDPPQYTP